MSRILFESLIVMCIGLCGQLAFAQPRAPAPVQWKQSIERPAKGWDYDGSRILGHLDHDICLWDATNGQLRQRLKEHRETIQKVQFSPDGLHALSSSWIGEGPMTHLTSKDTRTILWNLATGHSTQIFPGQVAGEFSPDGTRIITFSQQPGVSSFFNAAVWDVLTGRELVNFTLDDNSGPYSDTLHFSPDGKRLVFFAHGACLLYNSSVAVLYDARDGKEVGRVSVKDGVHRYTSSGALACFDSERASMFDIESGRAVQIIEHGVKGVWRGAWTHDGRKVAAFPIDGAIKIWDIESGKTITGAQGGHYPQYVAIISPDNSRLVIGWGGANVENKDIKSEFGIYDMNTGHALSVNTLASKRMRVIGFSPDNKTFLLVGPESAIYDAVDGKRIRTLTLESLDAP